MTRVVVPLVGEAYRDAVSGERPEFLDEPVVQLLGPFTVLFGDYNPAGRLPVTFYKSENQLPPFADCGMKGRTYRYFDGDPLYSFGYGLSYTSFAYRNLLISEQVQVGSSLKVSVQVENVGTRAGEEDVQLYLKHTNVPSSGPIRALEGFERISLDPGQKKTVEFTLVPRLMARVDSDGRRVLEPGMIENFSRRKTAWCERCRCSHYGRPLGSLQYHRNRDAFG